MGKKAPCGGCPPCCNTCVFSSAPRGLAETPRLVVREKEYGCVHGGEVVRAEGTLGLLREDGFRPVTAEGAAFLHASKNPLATSL